MDSSEPSTNGVSSSNLYRLSSIFKDESYAKKAKETVKSFESEMLQYPWLFPSFMPAIVASHLGLVSMVIHDAPGDNLGGRRVQQSVKEPRGSLGSIVRLNSSEGIGQWLRERNPSLKDGWKSDKTKILICENGVCKEEEEPIFVDSGVKMEESPMENDSFQMTGLKESLSGSGESLNQSQGEPVPKGNLQQVDLGAKTSVADKGKEN